MNFLKQLESPELPNPTFADSSKDDAPRILTLQPATTIRPLSWNVTQDGTAYQTFGAPQTTKPQPGNPRRPLSLEENDDR